MNPEPAFRSVDAFCIVGVERYTSNGVQAIQEAWREFDRRSAEVPHRSTPEVRYGYEDYSRDFSRTPGEFPKYYYLAGVQVDRLEGTPAGMTAKEVPAARYAVFTHRGPSSGIAPLFRFIYDTWLPSSEYVLDPAVQGDFERYAERITDLANIASEIYIPVVRKIGG